MSALVYHISSFFVFNFSFWLLIKNAKGLDILKKLGNKNVNVRQFASTKARCIKCYVKSSLKKSPNHSVLHVVRNGVDQNVSTRFIAKSVVDLAADSKSENDVTISNIIV